MSRALLWALLWALIAAPEARAERVVFAAPLLSYDSNLLLGLGAWAQVVLAEDEADGADASGAPDWPYRASAAAQLYWTTGGHQSHYLQFDLPGLLGSRLRWDMTLRRIVWNGAPYYGLGGDLPVDPAAPEGYYTYDQSRNQLQTGLRRALRDPWEIFGIYTLRFESVGVYGESLLEADRPEGAGGGRYALLEVGGRLDTRDSEIDPLQGWVVDLSGRSSGPWVGSEWITTGAHLTARRYASLRPRLSYAGRALLDLRWGDEPFFNMAYAGGLGRNVMGGRWIFRGYKEERFRGDGLAALQNELRWRFASFSVLDRPTEWMLVPFVDLGEVWIWEEGALSGPLLTSGGVGVRTVIQELLVLRADTGVAAEPTVGGVAPQVQVYVLAEHPF